jgi:tRNA-2-methylthio-N6-dimethylallyladenosine synthase
MTAPTAATAKQQDNQRKVFIKTYGCQMNVYDSQRMGEVLGDRGYAVTDTVDDADLVILNTCHIREKAAEKVYSELGRLRQLKQNTGSDMKIAVAGCVAQAEGEEIVRRAPVVDLVFGPQTYHRFPPCSTSTRGPAMRSSKPSFRRMRNSMHLMHLPPARRSSAAWLLSSRCRKVVTSSAPSASCPIPAVRSSPARRPASSPKARQLVDSGVREITLLGQNVNAWHGDGLDGSSWTLGHLLDELSGIEGLERLRYTTSHPRDMDDALIAAHGTNPKVMPYLHLPVQSGSDRILKAMNRKHTAESYVELVARIRKARPDIAMSSDFIVGFPGETAEDFEATMNVVREVTYAQAFSFKYSPRPGTPAAGHEEQVPEDVKSERLARLQTLLNEQQAAFNRSCVGRTLDVLLEKPGRKPGQLVGRSPYLQSVFVDAGDRQIGETVRVEITETGPNSLTGHMVDA